MTHPVHQWRNPRPLPPSSMHCLSGTKTSVTLRKSRSLHPGRLIAYLPEHVCTICGICPHPMENALSEAQEDTDMAVAKKSQEKHQIAPEVMLAGLLALLVDERESRTKDDREAVKTEVLLSNAGLSITDIAVLTGKKYDTVKISLQRSRAK